MSTTTEEATELVEEPTAAGWLALALTVVGALNWGLVGIGGFAGIDLNLVALLLGGIPAVENVVYLLVGIAGVYLAYVVARSR